MKLILQILFLFIWFTTLNPTPAFSTPKNTNKNNLTESTITSPYTHAELEASHEGREFLGCYERVSRAYLLLSAGKIGFGVFKNSINLMKSSWTKFKTSNFFANYKTLNPTNATKLESEVKNVIEEADKLDGVVVSGGIGTYTTKIKWGIFDIDARPFENKGYWGKRITQNDLRVDAFELKVNPNNESFYVAHPNGGFVQFENINLNSLQDGKMVLQPNNSMYRVYDKPEFLRQKVLDEAIRQTQAANAKGLTVEWLVSDQIATTQLTQFFAEKNVNIIVKFLAE